MGEHKVDLDQAFSQPQIGENWNVVVTTFEEGYRAALRALRPLGQVERSRYHNVLLMTVDNPLALLQTLEERAAHEPVLLDTISRVAPAATAFNFSSIVDFEEKAKNAVTQWVPSLMRASFHVRLHHRGRKEAIATTAIERSIGEYLLDRLAAAGTPGRIAFENPDAVIAVDTVDSRAGIGLWTRDDLGRYRFLRPD